MFRKTMLALAATVAVGAAVMTPTAASAWHFHGHGFYGYGWRFAPVVVAPVVASCYRYRLVETRRGLRRILVNVCAY
jgi:hypothetical protein